jgi:hypothetical protein
LPPGLSCFSATRRCRPRAGHGGGQVDGNEQLVGVALSPLQVLVLPQQ